MAKMGSGSIKGPAKEARVQSKVNSALSYGRATGKTYINKPEKPKKKTPTTPGGYVSSSEKKRVPPKARGGR